MITKIRSLSRFVTQKPNASLLLFLTTIAAIVLANSPLVDAYNSCLEYPLDFRFDNFIFFPHHGQPMSLTTLVNDAFMAIFFFVEGMEIKQELLVGELSSARKALLPVIADCGGMIVPVLVYLSVCHSGPAAHGAAIPMANDIAFDWSFVFIYSPRPGTPRCPRQPRPPQPTRLPDRPGRGRRHRRHHRHRPLL